MAPAREGPDPETRRTLVLRPLELEDPSRQVRLVEAEMTPALEQYLKGMDTVTQYVSRTFSLFPTARSRRPQQLLTKVKR
jgi:hypothetical protein